MATKTVDVDEMMNTVLVCDVCMEPFDSAARVPLLLPCRYSFCVSCLESLSKGGDFRCPTCRHLVTVNGSVALSLPKDIISLKVVDYLVMKSAAHTVPCTDCVDKNTASYRCLTCHLNMCKVCQNGHRRVPFFHNHNIRTLGELAEAPAEFLAEAETCVEHVGMTLNLYCDSEACKVALCTSCAMVAHRQDSHNIMDLSKVHKRAKQEHLELLGLLEKQEKKQRGLSEDFQKKMELVETSAAKSTDQVNQAMDRQLEAVEKRRKQLLEEVMRVKDRQKAELRKMQEETSSHVSQIQEATGYLRRAERLSRQAEFISVVHAQGPSVQKLVKSGLLADGGRAFSDDYPGLWLLPRWLDSITFEAGDVEKSVEAVLALGSVSDQWILPVGFKQTKCGPEQTKTPVRSSSIDEEEEEVDEYEPNVNFKPVITLSELVPTLTGEENEEKVFGERARLFRFDSETSQWKEHGIGELKILRTPSINQVRILMHREQVLKVCANHNLTRDMRLTPMASSDRAWCWRAMDYAEESLRMEKFAAKFKTPELAALFKEKFEACQKMLGEGVRAAKDVVDSGKKSQPLSSSEVSSTTSVETVGPAGPALSLADQFQRQAGGWECQGCYIQNPATVLQCPACQTLKPGTTPEEVKGLTRPEKKKPATSFQFGAAPTIQSSGFTFGSAATPSHPSQSTPLSELLKQDESSWECQGCLLFNKADVLKCPACQALKPGVKPEEVKGLTRPEKKKPATSFKFGAAPTIQSSGFIFGSAATPSHPSQSTPLSELLKQDVSSWECQGCYIKNPGTVLQCPACQALKPGVKPEEVKGLARPEKKKPATSFQFGAAPTIQSSGFTFGSAATPSHPSQSTPLSELLKQDESSWECQGCYIQNPATVLQCPACQTLKPGATPEEVKGLTRPEKKKPATSFQFGSAPTIQSSGFIFGSAATPSHPSQSTPLSELLKQDESSWECQGCLLSNKADVLKCPHCQALKPEVKPEDVKDAESGVKAGPE